MPLTNEGKLSTCLIDSNCVLVEWAFKNVEETYERLILIASSLPRTQIVEKKDNYWHGVCRSLVFRFPDDLKILQIPRERLIQVKSASRVGVSDLGVNERRVAGLYSQLKILYPNLKVN